MRLGYGATCSERRAGDEAQPRRVAEDCEELPAPAKSARSPGFAGNLPGILGVPHRCQRVYEVMNPRTRIALGLALRQRASVSNLRPAASPIGSATGTRVTIWDVTNLGLWLVGVGAFVGAFGAVPWALQSTGSGIVIRQGLATRLGRLQFAFGTTSLLLLAVGSTLVAAGNLPSAAATVATVAASLALIYGLLVWKAYRVRKSDTAKRLLGGGLRNDPYSPMQAWQFDCSVSTSTLWWAVRHPLGCDDPWPKSFKRHYGPVPKSRKFGDLDAGEQQCLSDEAENRIPAALRPLVQEARTQHFTVTATRWFVVFYPRTGDGLAVYPLRGPSITRRARRARLRQGLVKLGFEGRPAGSQELRSAA